jgi:HD-GYP domain-containing protein (c-di-GMP phosphodiesterase class II)
MADSRELLQRISALRHRLDQAQSLLREPEKTAPNAGAAAAEKLQDKVRVGAWHHHLLDAALRPLADHNAPATMPARLTLRALRILEKGKELVHDLKALADDTLLKDDEQGPLARLHAQTVAMLEAVLRMVQVFPPSPSAQVRLCSGLEEMILEVAQRRGALHQAVQQRRLELQRRDRLADLLGGLAKGAPVRSQDLHALAEELLEDAAAHRPPRWAQAPTAHPARWVAAHGLNVAQVMARILAGRAASSGMEVEELSLALVHDVGMLRLPEEIFSQPTPLNDEQRRQLERHPALGAQLAGKLWTGGGWPEEAIHDHHERIDGTGYPGGKRDGQLSPQTRLLAVCDVYAALCCHRPYRAALETRSALTDTLLLADQGALDRVQGEKLLLLSFFPIGSVVELSDGAVGVVIATQPGDRGLLHPSRPILHLLCDAHGEPLAAPKLLDLAVEEGRSIVRALSENERFKWLGRKYPALV